MKTLIIGAAIAAAAGVAAGNAFQPVLALGPAPMQAAPFGAAPTGDYQPADVWTHPGPPPAYVVGTDWLPRDTPPLLQADATLPDAEAPPPEPHRPPPYVRADETDELSVPPPAYPSEHGDILAGRTAPPTDGAARPDAPA